MKGTTLSVWPDYAETIREYVLEDAQERTSIVD
jgi:hypothetical protein